MNAQKSRVPTLFTVVLPCVAPSGRVGDGPRKEWAEFGPGLPRTMHCGVVSGVGIEAPGDT